MTWNINGLLSKFHDIDFVKFCRLFDLICFTETWSASKQDLISILNDYCVFACNGEKPRRGRIAGGVCIFIKSCILSGIELLKTKQKDSVFLLLKKNCFDFKTDIIFGVVYIPPSDSMRHKRNPNLSINCLIEVLSDLTLSLLN